MNKFLPNLLLVMSLALCGLSAYQWVREGRLHTAVAELHALDYTNRLTIQGLEGIVKQEKAEIDRLENVRTKLESTVATNTAQIREMEKALDRLAKENLGQRDSIDQFKAALDTANERIKSQNEDVRRQNEAIKAVAEQRDQKVEELKKMVGEYNKVVGEYNKLVEEFEKLAKQMQGGNTNKPDGKK